MTRRAPLKKADLIRYAQGMQAAGVAEWRVEIDLCGKVSIIVGQANTSVSGPDPDELLR